MKDEDDCLQAGRAGFDSGQGIFPFATASNPALGPTKPPIHWVPGAFIPGVKRPGRKANHSALPNGEIKSAWHGA